MGKPRQASASRGAPRAGERHALSGTHRIPGKTVHPPGAKPAGHKSSGTRPAVANGGARPHTRKAAEITAPTSLEMPPAGLCSTTFRLGSDKYAVLSFPVRAL